MIAPDIFKIAPARDNVHFFNTQLDTDFVRKNISSHHFNYAVVAVFPDTLQIRSDIKNSLLHDSNYYLFPNFPIFNFLDYTFIEAFVKRGEVTALSVNTMLDVENCYCLTPKGHLILSLQRNYFLQLGIEQGPSITIKQIDNRYLVIINLKVECFNPKKKNYQRAYKQLNSLNLQADVIVSWEPNDINKCPSSLASYFHTKGIECKECELNYKEKRNYEVMLPKFQTPHCELFEWLGIYLLGGPELTEDKTHLEYLTTYQVPGDSEVVGQVLTCEWAGFLPSTRILKLLDAMKEYVSARSNIPWVALHVHGFEDSPVSWNLQHHKFTTNGDNNYTIIFDKSNNVKMCKSFTSLKKL